MNAEQYERWQDFALRMARTCFPGHRRPNSRWIIEVVQAFFDYLDTDDIPCIVNWDNSTEYPEGNALRGRECLATYCNCDGKRRKVSGIPDPECPECHGSGMRRAWERPYGIGDQMSEFLIDLRGYAPCCRACSTYVDDMECRCDHAQYLYSEQWDEQWGGPVRCCIRAGLDFASESSAGVLGFTAGDLRRMYPEGVPEWVFPPGERLRYFMTNELNGTFAELPDSAGVVL